MEVKDMKNMLKTSKGKIILSFCLVTLTVAAFGIWQYYTNLPPSIGESKETSSSTETASGVTSSSTETTSGATSSSSNQSEVLAPDFSLNDINGSRFTLKELEGRVVIVHFMAVGCGGQIRAITDHQLKQLKKVCDNHCGSSNLTMITVVVSTCEGNTLDLIRTFYNITWFFGNDYDDKKLEIIDAYEKYSILDGSIILIDKSLRVAEVYIEEIDAGSLSTTLGRL